MKRDFFPERPDNSPKIYAYTENTPEYKDLIKIGYTARSLDERMKEHYPTKGPTNIKRYEVLLLESSMRNDGSYFLDKDVHKVLIENGYKNVGGEWFNCKINDVKSAIISLKENIKFDKKRNKNFDLRPEQKDAINKTTKYFKNFHSLEKKTPHFLWNCKMRFGKTFATYKLALKMKWKKILILTFKPAVENSWREDLFSHINFKEWQFISKDTNSYNDIDKSKPFACFASFQDFLGKNSAGGIKIKNKWAHKIKWDCIVLDEYHYGSWRETAKELYEHEEKREQVLAVGEGIESWDENISPLKTSHYLYLSGTPFRAIESGEFIEEQIFNWTYSDEQNAKNNWKDKNSPYKSLPRMVMMTYQLPEQITQITSTGEFNEFDLNVFFKATGEKDKSEFLYKNEVQKWLDLIRGSGFENIYDSLKLGISKPVLPFSDTRLLNALSHTFWFLPSVSSCYAMKNLLIERQNTFFQDYEVIVCAGAEAGIGVKSVKPVLEKMHNPQKSKSITLSCGKLTTGVTIKPWTGIFMLRNTTSPETYFQSAFRVQSPWTIPLENKNDVNEELIIKGECYVFDFAPNRALRLITEYSTRLDINDKNPVSKIDEFIKFLPVLCFDGSSMRQINANEVLDYGMLGTSGSQLARKFESARLVNVDDMTLKRLLDSPDILNALMNNVEGFRNLNSDLEKIINKSEKINKIKKNDKDDKLSKKDKKELSDEEKEIKSKRKLFQEKLQKLSTRIPVFMYLTDYREETLKDVITKIEPGLFNKVTGISVKIFEKMVSIGLFNSTRMNSAVFAFKRYENSSLEYAGGFRKNKLSEVGLFDTKISPEEFLNSD
tara:strand:+ start:2367 stop:4865 length:2499 start_codon:yes stop_codon:yes gene_type:complete